MLQVVRLFLPCLISLSDRIEKNTESGTGRPLKKQSPELEFRGGKLWTQPFFWGGKFWTLSFQRVASSGLCFSPFWHIGKLGGGKNSGTPCTILHHSLYNTTLHAGSYHTTDHPAPFSIQYHISCR